MSAAVVVGAVFARSWAKVRRRPVVLAFSFAQPMIWMLLFGFLFQRYPINGPRGPVPYLDFLVPGVCGMTVLFGASQSGIELVRDFQTGFLPRVLATPASRALVLLGKVTADVTRLLLQAAVVLVLGTALGARLAPSWGATFLAALALGLFGAALCSLSCTLALTTRANETMAIFVHLVNMPLLFTSSALVPGKQMPEVLAAVARVNPLSLAVSALRGAVLFDEPPSLAGCLAPLAAIAAALFGMGVIAMGRAARTG